MKRPDGWMIALLSVGTVACWPGPSGASATSYSGAPSDNETIAHPLGEMRRGTARRFCSAPHVFVGRIVAVDSYVHTETSWSTGPHTFDMSDVTFEVEAVLHGEPGRLVTLKVEGHPVSATSPLRHRYRIQPVVGYRYAVGYQPRPAGSFPAQILYSHVRMDPSVPLEPELRAAFKDATKQHCPAPDE